MVVLKRKRRPVVFLCQTTEDAEIGIHLAKILVSLYLYACLLAMSIGYQLRNATVVCLWCIPSPLYLFLSLWHVFRGLPRRLFSGGFRVMAGWESGGFQSVCPVHLNFLFFISFSNRSCLFHFQLVVLEPCLITSCVTFFASIC